ncbi:phage baseplate assembly protein V [Pararhizobium sp. BT-229]|uniref:phage baseplate assembly protein V n=1 Tax=Pararhizobium sp. BT-229 TaxID=2986923 RepID=UPI0021F771A3|nr:phage baseplate assembly protein V [Pararhizobium sp. BT-229]MCV9961731.1 phage baseplate assembly protein V [Pararhizobium sp. BT-229]
MNMISPQSIETNVEAGGSAKGVAVAIVCQNRDDSGLGRVRVTYPWHTIPHQSYWARIVTPMAGKDRGIYFLPEIDDEVLVAFERGDVRFPYVIGGLWSGQDPAPQNNGDGHNDIRVIKTRKGHTLTFDDGAKGVVRLELNDGKKLEIDDDGIKLDDASGNSLVIESRGGTMSISAMTKLSLSAPTVEINAKAKATVETGGLLTLKGGLVAIN